MDNLLVELLVDEYRQLAEQLLPDLIDSVGVVDVTAAWMEAEASGDEFVTQEYDREPDDTVMRDTLTDCMADRICDGECHEHKGNYCPEFREAAKLIARYYYG